VVWVGHADVDDGDLGCQSRYQLEQLVDVAGLPGHLEAGVGQQPGDPLAKQRGVVGEHDLHRRLTAAPAHRGWPGRGFGGLWVWSAWHGSHARTTVP
jgi:hypothetical protein